MNFNLYGRHLVLDTTLPDMAFVAYIIKSNNPYGDRLAFVPAHRFRKSGQEVASILTTAAFAIAAETGVPVQDVLDAALTECRRIVTEATSGKLAVAELGNFLANNVLYINMHDSTIFFFSDSIRYQEDDLIGIREELAERVTKHYPNLPHEDVNTVVMSVLAHMSSVLKRAPRRA